MRSSLIPKLFSILKEEKYTFSLFNKDLFAGIVVGVLSIPMSIAYAIVSGARPEQGLYTAIIGGFFVAVLGGCRVQVAGPTGAFVLLIYATISQFGYDGLVIATLIAGILLVIMAFSKAGFIIKFIPYPVTIGFTSGLALILFVNQIPDVLGINIPNMPKDFFSKLYVLSKNLHEINIFSLIIALISVCIVVIWPKYVKKIPGSLIAIIFCSFLVFYLSFEVDIIKDKFGEIKSAFPTFQLPKFSWNKIIEVIPSSIAIALLAGMEALLAALVGDGMMSRRHRSDSELLAQGAANIFSSFFGGIPATGTIARTATCIKTGGQTPFAAIFNVLTIVIVLGIFKNYVAYIPMASLAAVIMVVAYNMSEWRVFAKLFNSPKKDIAVLLITFFLTVFVDLITAIEIGVILAMFLFISNIVNISKIDSMKQNLANDEKNRETSYGNISQDIEIFEISGPLFFAACEKFKMTLTRINRFPKVLILRLKYVNYIDASAIRALEDILHKCKKDDTILFLSGVNKDVMNIMIKTNFINKIKKENVFNHINEAIKEAQKICIPKETVKSQLEV
ncbi:MAG: STAS domain-containing protein [Parachlamydiales bacterium]|nr:STAS domain-containing protein [Parachlamydiales bacterium]